VSQAAAKAAPPATSWPPVARAQYGTPQGDGERICLSAARSSEIVVGADAASDCCDRAAGARPCGWAPHCQERRKGRCRQQEEEADPDGAAERGQHQPDATRRPPEQPDRVAMVASAGHRRSHRIDQRGTLQSAGQQRVAIAEFRSAATLSIGRSVKRVLPSRESAPTINHSMQYARRQRAKGRRPLINSAALPGQKAARTDLLPPPLAVRH